MPELFYDCGAYGLFTLDTERWQPTYRGKVADPAEFKPNPIVPLNDETWNTFAPIIQAMGGKAHVIDVGGYIGTFTIPMAINAERRGYSLTFDVFEPGPTRHVLAKNIELNGLSDRVRLHDAAVSGVVGKITYRWREDGAIGGQVFADIENMNSRIVESVTIDALAKDLDGPLLIKLDTQGHEPDIMKGGLDTIAKKQAVWQIEFIAWAARKKNFSGQSFADFLLQEFHCFEGDRQIHKGGMEGFLNEVDARASRMADLLLIPKDAAFSAPILNHLWHPK